MPVTNPQSSRYALFVPTAPTLETPRLLLRAPAAEDFEAFAAFAADPEASQFLGGPQGRHAAWRTWCTLAGAWQIRGYSMFSVIEKSTATWIGRVGPWMPEQWPGTEVGWGIVRSAQRKGYAKEAAEAAIDFAFRELGFREVVHCIDPANLPSIALAQSLGSWRLRSGVRAPSPIDATWDIYGQSRDQWLGRRPSQGG